MDEEALKEIRCLIGNAMFDLDETWDQNWDGPATPVDPSVQYDIIFNKVVGQQICEQHARGLFKALLLVEKELGVKTFNVHGKRVWRDDFIYKKDD
jgi:hypothetical protein